MLWTVAGGQIAPPARELGDLIASGSKRRRTRRSGRVMRMKAPPLAPSLRSDVQGEVLALLLLDPDACYSLADVGRAVGAPAAVVHKEVSRLVVAGVLTDARQGRSRMVSANRRYRLLRPLTELIAGTYGPVPVLTSALEDVTGIHAAYLYGSWAARRVGDAGPAPRDVDVLVVGTTARAELNEVAAEAEARLRLPVNITEVDSKAWASSADSFLRTVRLRPLVELDLGSPDVR